MRSTQDKRPGQPSSDGSLHASGAGEGKRWRMDHMRYPTVRESHAALIAPTVAKTRRAYEPEYGIVIGPMGGRKRTLVGVEATHEHALARHNLAAAYAAFAATCPDPEVKRYARMAAHGRTAQADGRGNKLAAYMDRPRKQRKPAVPKPAPATRPNNTLAIVTGPPIHGTGCICFTCLLAL